MNVPLKINLQSVTYIVIFLTLPRSTAIERCLLWIKKKTVHLSYIPPVELGPLRPKVYKNRLSSEIKVERKRRSRSRLRISHGKSTELTFGPHKWPQRGETIDGPRLEKKRLVSEISSRNRNVIEERRIKELWNGTRIHRLLNCLSISLLTYILKYDWGDVKDWRNSRPEEFKTGTTARFENWRQRSGVTLTVFGVRLLKMKKRNKVFSRLGESPCLPLFTLQGGLHEGKRNPRIWEFRTVGTN